jgi:hypothetical protein
MATVTAGYNWVSGETVTPAKLNSAAAPTVVVADGEVTDAKLAATLDLSSKTVTLPDDSVTNAKLSLAANDGEIKKAINADNSAPIFACRAWVNFLIVLALEVALNKRADSPIMWARSLPL